MGDFGIVIRGLPVGALAGAYMSDAPLNDKEDQFERLWEGQTPKGYNRTKALKFRQYMRNHVMQKFHKRRKDQWATADKGHYNHAFSSKDQYLTKENCMKYWMGQLQKDIKEAETF